ncbi:DUF6520 family protein [Chryseobacterium balustinum]|uniref:Uncharacterized protein n=1 Tax=Chryseobacterium balustinum TaxID=246 RepID=A0AAX2IN04_9FLAO|nr:DUF6520 family protein [Chryseobacterium balustinum]AYM99212.1 hypothetical protein EAG08_01640 [Chryseobacterium sp. 3008163]AZB30267.1 hypothetical protein EB354_13955 [Chryseobacterium balustinum]SKC03470.1 hypothetical protein SAMN05421800_12254 [Chryseobacterium balustinum]SQA90903.1 Uncharacterised protein [Chryseobacterium balustinum]
MKKFLFPVVLVLVGTGSALATNVAKKSNKALVPAYRIVSVGGGQFQCQNAEQQCSDVNNGIVCKWEVDGTTDLHNEGSGTMCGSELFEIPN